MQGVLGDIVANVVGEIPIVGGIGQALIENRIESNAGQNSDRGIKRPSPSNTAPSSKRPKEDLSFMSPSLQSAFGAFGEALDTDIDGTGNLSRDGALGTMDTGTSGNCGCGNKTAQPEGYYGCRKKYTCEEKCAYGRQMAEKCTGCRTYRPRRYTRGYKTYRKKSCYPKRTYKKKWTSKKRSYCRK